MWGPEQKLTLLSVRGEPMHHEDMTKTHAPRENVDFRSGDSKMEVDFE